VGILVFISIISVVVCLGVEPVLMAGPPKSAAGGQSSLAARISSSTTTPSVNASAADTTEGDKLLKYVFTGDLESLKEFSRTQDDNAAPVIARAREEEREKVAEFFRQRHQKAWNQPNSTGISLAHWAVYLSPSTEPGYPREVLPLLMVRGV